MSRCTHVPERDVATWLLRHELRRRRPIAIFRSAVGVHVCCEDVEPARHLSSNGCRMKTTTVPLFSFEVNAAFVGVFHFDRVRAILRECERSLRDSPSTGRDPNLLECDRQSGEGPMIEAFCPWQAPICSRTLWLRRRDFDTNCSSSDVSWSIRHGLEFDEFDTPAAIYLVWRDDHRVVRVVARLLRTTRPHMLRSYWSYLVESGDLPSSVGIFEVTRVCVDKTFQPSVRRLIFPEPLCGTPSGFRKVRKRNG